MGCDMSRDADDPEKLPSMGPRPPQASHNQQDNSNKSQDSTQPIKVEEQPQGKIVTREQKIEITEDQASEKLEKSENSDDSDDSEEDEKSKAQSNKKIDELSGNEDDKDDESSGDEDDKSSGDEDDKSDDE